MNVAKNDFAKFMCQIQLDIIKFIVLRKKWITLSRMLLFTCGFSYGNNIVPLV